MESWSCVILKWDNWSAIMQASFRSFERKASSSSARAVTVNNLKLKKTQRKDTIKFGPLNRVNTQEIEIWWPRWSFQSMSNLRGSFVSSCRSMIQGGGHFMPVASSKIELPAGYQPSVNLILRHKLFQATFRVGIPSLNPNYCSHKVLWLLKDSI